MILLGGLGSINVTPHVDCVRSPFAPGDRPWDRQLRETLTQVLECTYG